MIDPFLDDVKKGCCNLQCVDIFEPNQRMIHSLDHM